MPEQPDTERLRALEARLAQVRTPTKQELSAKGKAFSQGEMAWRMVIELSSGLLIGVAIGYGLDHVFGTMPLFLVVFTLLGFVAGIKTVLGTAKEQAAKHNDGSQAANHAVSNEDKNG